MGDGANLSQVREAVRCFLEQDWDGLGRLFTPDAVMTPLEGWPEPGPFHGREEILREYGRLAEGFGVNELTLERVEELGDWVLGHFLWATEGASTGARQQVSYVAALHFEAGLADEAHFRWTREAALQAARLDET